MHRSLQIYMERTDGKRQSVVLAGNPQTRNTIAGVDRAKIIKKNTKLDSKQTSNVPC